MTPCSCPLPPGHLGCSLHPHGRTEARARRLLAAVGLGEWLPDCRHGVPEGKPCADCRREADEDAVAWTAHDEYRADHADCGAAADDRRHRHDDDEPRRLDDRCDGDGDW